MLIQYLAVAVVLTVTFFACRCYRKTVIVWMVVRTLFNAQIAVRYSTPAISCVMMTDFVLLILYFQKIKSRPFLQEKFVFRTPMIAVFFSFFLSTVFAPTIQMSGITATLKYFISNFIILYIFQQCLKDSKDLELFFKAAVAVVFLQMGNALYESIFRDNLWLDFVYFNSPHDKTTYGRMFYVPPQLGSGLEIRYGQVRVRSFFGLHITFGFFCLMYLYLLMVYSKKKWNFFSKNKLLKIAMLLLLAGVFMGNSKTSYIGLMILVLGIYSAKNIFNPKIIAPVIIACLVVILFFPDYLNNYASLFDSKVAEEGGGSTIEGRQNQFRIAQKMFEMNPLFGNGPGSIGLLKTKGFRGIMGAESSWMQILPERGLFGAVVYLFTYVCVFKKFKSVLGAKGIFFFLLSLLIMETATGILDMAIWGTILIVIRRATILNQQNSIYIK